MTLAQLKALGYCRTSWTGRIVARIDRPDWYDVMGLGHLHGTVAEDHYRRCYSKDVLTVSKHLIAQMPPSRHTLTGYVALPPSSP